MTISDDAITLHKKLKGKIYVESKIHPLTAKTLQLAYTPGVAAVCSEIKKKNSRKYLLTSKGNNVAIITDGTRILGLGKIGPDAALPVMEGKSVIYRKYGKISAFPLCLSTTDAKQIIQTVQAISPVFGAINLEDIESPKVLDISNELEKTLDIPVFHDDRHGTSVVVLAALLNSLNLVKKNLVTSKIVIAGAGSAGYCIAQLLKHAGARDIVVVDSKGVIYLNRKNMNKYKKEIAKFTNSKQKGNLIDVIKDADVFIGVSGIKNLITSKMVQSMNSNSIVFALTNPDPEINPIVAKKAGAKIVASGSYAYQNKVNNALVFPYLMRAILDLKIKKITMKILYDAALAVASIVSKKELTVNHIVPLLGDRRLQPRITSALKHHG